MFAGLLAITSAIRRGKSQYARRIREEVRQAKEEGWLMKAMASRWRLSAANYFFLPVS
jgi:hypothetical protein